MEDPSQESLGCFEILRTAVHQEVSGETFPLPIFTHQPFLRSGEHWGKVRFHQMLRNESNYEFNRKVLKSCLYKLSFEILRTAAHQEAFGKTLLFPIFTLQPFVLSGEHWGKVPFYQILRKESNYDLNRKVLKYCSYKLYFCLFLFFLR